MKLPIEKVSTANSLLRIADGRIYRGLPIRRMKNAMRGAGLPQCIRQLHYNLKIRPKSTPRASRASPATLGRFRKMPVKTPTRHRSSRNNVARSNHNARS
jgi:hypothetical protein